MKAVIANDSERAKATKGSPCFAAGRNRALPSSQMTTPSGMVSPCALFTVSAKPATSGICVLVMRAPSLRLVIGRMGTHFGSSA